MLNKICFLLLLFLTPIFSQTEWEKISFRDAGNSICLTIDSLGYIYNVTDETTDCSIFRSTDKGNTWSELNFGPSGTMIRKMVVTGKGDLIIGTYNLEWSSSEGIFLSTDHGDNWQAINGNLPSKYITALTCTQDNIIYVGITGVSLISNLYKSTDYGITWSPIKFTSTSFRYPTQLASFDNLLLCYTDWPDSIKYSTDGGASWTPTNYPQAVFTVRSSFAYKKSTGQLYFSNRYNAMENGHYYNLIVSADTFRTAGNIAWSQRPDYCHEIILDSDGNLLAASSGSGIMKSTDDGKTWIKKNNMDNPFINTLVIDKDENIYAGSTSGVIKSIDRGSTWIELTRGLNSKNISSLKTDQNGNLFIQALKAIFRFEVNGNRWEALNNGKKYAERSIIDIVGNKIFSCENYRSSRFEQDKFGYKFDHSSGKWLEINAYFTSVDEQPDGNLFAIFYEYSFSNGFFNSTDQGNTWTKLSAPPYKKIVQIDSRGYIYAAGTGLSKSYDNGNSFTPLNYNDEIYDFKIDNNDYIYIQPQYGEYSFDILRCKRAGGDWVNITADLPENGINKLYIDPSDRLFVIVDSSRIFCSSTSGDSWIEITGNLNKNDIVDISLGTNSMLYIGTLNGEVYKSKLTLTSDSNEYSLSQNYPNPFNSSTTINYSIPVPANVNIRLYDVLGNEAALLLDTYKEAGEYRYEIRLENLSSGVYLYKFESGRFISFKKLLLIK